MNCIILGDKYIKGMKSRGCCGLIPHSKSINTLENQYFVLKSIFPNIQIVYIYGFEDKKFSDFINKSNLELVSIYNPDYNKYNSAYSLNLAKNFLNDSSLIIDGYSFINKSLIKKIKHQEEFSQIIVSDKDNKDSSPGCIIIDNHIKNLSYDLSNNIKNVYYLTKTTSVLLQSIVTNKRNYNCFVFELINKIIESNSKQKFKPILL
jgi:CTP:phosphocholine cytidylyltransferase-like protein